MVIKMRNIKKAVKKIQKNGVTTRAQQKTTFTTSTKKRVVTKKYATPRKTTAAATAIKTPRTPQKQIIQETISPGWLNLRKVERVVLRDKFPQHATHNYHVALHIPEASNTGGSSNSSKQHLVQRFVLAKHGGFISNFDLKQIAEIFYTNNIAKDAAVWKTLLVTVYNPVNKVVSAFSILKEEYYDTGKQFTIIVRPVGTLPHIANVNEFLCLRWAATHGKFYVWSRFHLDVE
jgi:hypothetical protein